MNHPPPALGPGIFMVAGAGLTGGQDAAAYLVEDHGELALIDSGAGPGLDALLANIRAASREGAAPRYLVATHAHLDHIGCLAALARDFPQAITVAHVRDAWAIETADPDFTAASWYRLPLTPTPVGLKLEGRSGRLPLGRTDLHWVHIPGHTPGSIALYLDRNGRRYLFGQDIHGPFDPDFQSDIGQWRKSMADLLALEADILAEGHYGVIQGRAAVNRFIQGHLDRVGMGGI